MRSGLICPVTEKPCTDGLCKKDHCLTEIRDRIAAQQREAAAADDARATEILRAAGVPPPPLLYQPAESELTRDPDGRIRITEKKPIDLSRHRGSYGKKKP
jgi:hypothetical protein